MKFGPKGRWVLYNFLKFKKKKLGYKFEYMPVCFL